MKRVLALVLVLAACGSGDPVLTASPQDAIREQVNQDFMAQLTMNYWLRADDDRHRALCTLADAAHYLNQGLTIDVLQGGIFDTGTLNALCQRLPKDDGPSNTTPRNQ